MSSKTSTTTLTPPLKWHGGKHYLAKKIVALMPRHLHYVEPYFGGGAVLLARDPNNATKFWGNKSHERGVSEVVNDIDDDLMNFWRVLQRLEWFEQFRRLVGAVPFSEKEWEEASRETPYLDPVLCARDFFIRYRQSRQGLGQDFATLSRNRTRRGMNEQVSAWLSAIEGLPEAHERLQRVVILCRDALDVIRQQDGPKTLFYCDAPYLHETRASTNDYRHEMTEEDHVALLKTLSNIKGMFMLSGYRSGLYDECAKRNQWRRHL